METPIHSGGPQSGSFQTSLGESKTQGGVQPTQDEQHTSGVAHDTHLTPDDTKTPSLHQGNAPSKNLASPHQAKQSQPTEKTLSGMLQSAFQTVKGGLERFASATGKAISSAGRGVSDLVRDTRNEIESGDFIDNRKALLSAAADKASQKTGVGLDSKIEKLETSVKGLERKLASETRILSQLSAEKEKVTKDRDNASNASQKNAYKDRIGILDKQISENTAQINTIKAELKVATGHLKELKDAKGSSMLTNASRMAGNLKPLAQGLAGRIGIIKLQRPTSRNDEQLSATRAELATLTKADNEIGRQLKDLQETLSKYPENPSNPEQAKMKSSIKKQVQTLIDQRSANTKPLESLRENIQKMEGKQAAEEAAFKKQNPTLIDKAVSTAETVSSAVSSAFQSIKGLKHSDNIEALEARVSTALGDLKDTAQNVAQGAKPAFEALGRGIRDLVIGKKGEGEEGARISKGLIGHVSDLGSAIKAGLPSAETLSGLASDIGKAVLKPFKALAALANKESAPAQAQVWKEKLGEIESAQKTETQEVKDKAEATADAVANFPLPSASTLTGATSVTSGAILNPEHPVTPPQIHTGTTLFPAMLSDVKLVNASIGGSTGAKLMEAGGEKFVQKEGPVQQQGAVGAAKHITAEYHANVAYKALGVDVPEVKLYTKTSSDAINGQAASEATPVMLASFVKDAKPLGKYLAENPGKREEVIAKVQKDFIADVLLANWDVVGMGMDNILVTSDGTPVRVDNGSCFEFRAQGDEKSIPKLGISGFSDKAIEVDSFRNPQINPQAAQMFGSISDKEIIRQIDEMAGKMDQLLAATPPKYHDALEGRMAYLQEYKKGLESKLGIKQETAASSAVEQKDKTKAAETPSKTTSVKGLRGRVIGKAPSKELAAKASSRALEAFSGALENIKGFLFQRVSDPTEYVTCDALDVAGKLEGKKREEAIANMAKEFTSVASNALSHVTAENLLDDFNPLALAHQGMTLNIQEALFYTNGTPHKQKTMERRFEALMDVMDACIKNGDLTSASAIHAALSQEGVRRIIKDNDKLMQRWDNHVINNGTTSFKKMNAGDNISTPYLPGLKNELEIDQKAGKGRFGQMTKQEAFDAINKGLKKPEKQPEGETKSLLAQDLGLRGMALYARNAVAETQSNVESSAQALQGFYARRDECKNILDQIKLLPRPLQAEDAARETKAENGLREANTQIEREEKVQRKNKMGHELAELGSVRLHPNEKSMNDKVWDASYTLKPKGS
ncbi:hypothetical protein [Estrella lausannensis]|uniref:Uncharacterized protein n=1 Tax=Estrella lausannensis TaxID=483423 RepID=A0A0H5DRF8_9BACT|nr:hypothetical protein [Estrella lausannensis]CRX39281.1 hypothetical protein ELAC_1959 [Estrella lausannensis]